MRRKRVKRQIKTMKQMDPKPNQKYHLVEDLDINCLYETCITA